MTDTTDTSDDRIERLERENEQLRERLATLESVVAEQSDVETAADGRASDAAGDALTSGGQPSKVIGRLSDTDGIGVVGEATGSGVTRGVEGIVQSSSDGAAGVNAEAQGSSGDIYGVRARTQTDRFDGAAVDARAPTGSSQAVRADTTGADGNAVYATVDSDIWHAVRAEHNATSGASAQAIEASTGSPDCAAVRAVGSGGGAFKAIGSVKVNDDTDQRTAGPIAKAFIDQDSTIRGGVNVDSVTYDSAYRAYIITLSSVSYVGPDYATLVTPFRGGHVIPDTSVNASDLLVSFEDTSGSEVKTDFQFAVFELPDGSVTTATAATTDETQPD